VINGEPVARLLLSLAGSGTSQGAGLRSSRL